MFSFPFLFFPFLFFFFSPSNSFAKTNEIFNRDKTITNYDFPLGSDRWITGYRSYFSRINKRDSEWQGVSRTSAGHRNEETTRSVGNGATRFVQPCNITSRVVARVKLFDRRCRQITMFRGKSGISEKEMRKKKEKGKGERRFSSRSTTSRCLATVLARQRPRSKYLPLEKAREEEEEEE